MNDSLRRRLVELVDTLAVQRGAFTLASGRTSDYYIDMRRATLHHEAGPLHGLHNVAQWESQAYGAGVLPGIRVLGERASSTPSAG